MIGRERELEELDGILSRTRAKVRAACSCSQGRRASARRGWPRPPLPPRQLACLRGVAAEHGGLAVCAHRGGAPRVPPPRAGGALRGRAALRAPRRPVAGARTGARSHRSRDAVRSGARRLRDDLGARGDGRLPRRPPVGGRGDARAPAVARRSGGGVAAARARRLPQRGDPARPPAAAAPRSTSAVQGGSRSSAWSRSIPTGPLGSRRRSSAASRAPRFARRSTTARRECRSSWRSSRRRCEPAAARAGAARPRARGRVGRSDPGDASRRAPRPSRGPVGRGTSRPRGGRRDRRRGRARAARGARPRRRPGRAPRPRSAPRGRAGTRGVPARSRPGSDLRRYPLAEAPIAPPRAGLAARRPRRRAEADGRPLAGRG